MPLCRLKGGAAPWVQATVLRGRKVLALFRKHRIAAAAKSKAAITSAQSVNGMGEGGSGGGLLAVVKDEPWRWHCEPLNALLRAAAAASRSTADTLEGEAAAETLTTVGAMVREAIGFDATGTLDESTEDDEEEKEEAEDGEEGKEEATTAATWLLDGGSISWLLSLRAAAAVPPTERFIIERQRAFLDAVPALCPYADSATTRQKPTAASTFLTAGTGSGVSLRLRPYFASPHGGKSLPASGGPSGGGLEEGEGRGPLKEFFELVGQQLSSAGTQNAKHVKFPQVDIEAARARAMSAALKVAAPERTSDSISAPDDAELFCYHQGSEALWFNPKMLAHTGTAAATDSVSKGEVAHHQGQWQRFAAAGVLMGTALAARCTLGLSIAPLLARLLLLDDPPMLSDATAAGAQEASSGAGGGSDNGDGDGDGDVDGVEAFNASIDSSTAGSRLIMAFGDDQDDQASPSSTPLPRQSQSRLSQRRQSLHAVTQAALEGQLLAHAAGILFPADDVAVTLKNLAEFDPSMMETACRTLGLSEADFAELLQVKSMGTCSVCCLEVANHIVL